MGRRNIAQGADTALNTNLTYTNAIEISQGSLTCPSIYQHIPPFYCYSQKPPFLVAFYDMLGIRRTYSHLKPLGPHGNQNLNNGIC